MDVLVTETTAKVSNRSSLFLSVKMSHDAAKLKATSSSADKLTFDLSHRAQVLLEAIVKLRISDRLKVTGVNPARGCGVAALAHARVVAQPTFI